jgi:Domain of unknown function (DUF4188)
MTASRQTVDLAPYPDLVVVYLGMRVNVLTGIKTLLGFGPKIEGSVASKPDGLLLHENMIYSLFPPHVGMRQYWRDFESLERWTHADPHRTWWKQFLQDTGGTSFWHELYSVRGGFESVYIDVEKPIGFLRFANPVAAKAGLFSPVTACAAAEHPKRLRPIQKQSCSVCQVYTCLELSFSPSSLSTSSHIRPQHTPPPDAKSGLAVGMVKK